MLRTNKQIKHKKLMRVIRNLCLTSFLTYSTLVSAVGPDQIQIEDDSGLIQNSEAYRQGAFDLQSESSSIVSAATGGVKGHYPGIRTIATVNNSEGKLRICSTVTAHYQILDIDGDWDFASSFPHPADVTDGDTTYKHMKTSDTIVWYLKDGKNAPVAIPQELIDAGVVSQNKLSIKIPAEMDFNDGLGKRSTKGMTLQYQITPWTMIGSIPRTLGEVPDQEFTLDQDALAKGEIPVVVSNLTLGRYLEPNSFLGVVAEDYESDQIQSSITKGAFTFPGLPEPTGNNSFITVLEIGDADPADCITIQPSINVRILDKNGNNVLDENKPALWVTNEYTALVEITDEAGNVRKLTQKEFENKEMPFSWNIYYKLDEKCEFNPLTVKSSNECFIKESFTKDDPRMSVKFDENGYMEEAKLIMQQTNENAKIKLPPNYSEQGYFVTVSFGYDNSIK